METKSFVIVILLFPLILQAQVLTAYQLKPGETISVDGKLTESAWYRADSIANLTMVEPDEGALPSQRTVVRVITDATHLYIGVRCYDTHPDQITVFSKIRDSWMGSEDRIKFVFDTNLDGRTGFIFAVNPAGTRYDALVSNFGEGENKNWDAIWDAHTSRDANGWTVEAVIPIQSLTFAPGLREWGFNIERRIQRNLETDRWAGIKRDYRVSQVAHAGRLVGLPDFELGIGLMSKLSLIGSADQAIHQTMHSNFNYSLDFSQKITSDILAQLTINTDFAETEVDARRTNLTRFPLFFPEKRTFFLEGSDIFDFGIGLGHELIPFYSRRIGLYKGQKVPIVAGGKINGRSNHTQFGGLVVHTAQANDTVPAATLGIIRVKQNILEESSMGVIATYGNPYAPEQEWLGGADIVYQNTRFMGDKNFLIGAWGLYNHNSLTGDHSAVGFKIDYPNDLLDISLTVKKIGDAFQPSLGFVPRPGIYSYRFGLDYMPRPSWQLIRQFFFESGVRLITNLNHEWETYRIFTAPIHFLLESGDRFEFNIAPAGENLPEDFEISDGVVIPKGPYHWRRYRLEFESASKRPINGQITWWFGSFYDGKLDQIELELNMRPSANINLTVNAERNIGRLPEGHFIQDLFGARLQFSFAPNFELSSFIQYDNESQSLGTNTRLRWTFNMLGDLFIVYNHNINHLENGYWQYDSNQLIVKLSYGLWH